MIPLRSTEGVDRFPKSTLIFCLILLLLNAVYYLSPQPQFFSFGPQPLNELKLFGWNAFISAWISPSIFKLLVNVLFVWVFAPKVFERRGYLIWYFIFALVGTVLARESFFGIHSEYWGPLPAFDAATGVLLGMSLRSEIWSTLTTAVVGLGWIRVFEVPSYVLLFFWLFYLFLGNLFMRSPYSDAPMLYWLPFVGLIWGFLAESLLYFMSKMLQKKLSKGE